MRVQVFKRDGKMFFADSSYNVQSNRKNDQAENDVLGLKDIKDTVKGLVYMMKLGSYRYVSCSYL